MIIILYYLIQKKNIPQLIQQPQLSNGRDQFTNQKQSKFQCEERDPVCVERTYYQRQHYFLVEIWGE